MTTEIRKGWCGPCHTRCGLLVYLNDGHAVKVEGDPHNPTNRGSICPRGRLILEHLYHPDRVNFPLKRVGARGSAKWQRISWYQALDEIATKLGDIKGKYGAEAVAFSHGTFRTYDWAIRRFYNLFGSPNHGTSGAICMCPCESVEWSTYGHFAWPDMPNSKCVVVWGYQPSKSSLIASWRNLIKARENGAKIIVVDPRRTKETMLADLWLQIRPGTDLALMLGWLKVIIDEELYDQSFVNQWTVGFDDLRERLDEYSLDMVTQITWIPVQKIIQSARLYAESRPATITWGLGIDMQGVNATQAARARCILRAISGNLDVKGGELLGFSPQEAKVISDVEMEMNEALPKEQRDKQLGADRYRLFGFPGWELINEASLKLAGTYVRPPTTAKTANGHQRAIWEAIITGRPYPIKALMVQANNPLLQAPDTRLVHEALTHTNLDLMVVMDYYMTPTAELADYVLPAACTLERSDFPDLPKVMEPLYERRSDYELWRELGMRLGQGEHWPWKTAEEVCDYRLRPLGVTYQEAVDNYGFPHTTEYKKYERYGFGTPSGKVEISSSIFAKLGYDPLPAYREPPETPISDPKLAKEYPLILIAAARFLPMYHSELRQIPKARKENPDPLVLLNHETGKRLGLADGDWAWIETTRGKIKQRVKLTNDVHPAMVSTQHGWWFPEMPGEDPCLHGLWESNANILCPVDDKYCSPEVGSWPHTALLCKVYKVE